MPVNDAPDDDAVRQSYNFAPGYHGLVYRADGSDYGGHKGGDEEEQGIKIDKDESGLAIPMEGHDDTKYKLQAMKWVGLRFPAE